MNIKIEKQKLFDQMLYKSQQSKIHKNGNCQT